MGLYMQLLNLEIRFYYFNLIVNRDNSINSLMIINLKKIGCQNKDLILNINFMVLVRLLETYN